MPVLLQVLIGTVAIGLLITAVLTARMVTQGVRKLTEDVSEITDTLESSAEQIKLVTVEVRALVASGQRCVDSIEPVVERFASVGHRTASVSSALLNVLEPPVLSAASVSVGVRAATGHIVRRLLNRFTARHSSSHGDNGHE